MSAPLEEWEATLLSPFKDADGNFPKLIDAKDVRIGDRLARIFRDKCGDLSLWIGTVTRVAVGYPHWAETEAGVRLAWGSGLGRTFLLERPAPPLPSEEGAVILVSFTEEDPVWYLRVLRNGAWCHQYGDPCIAQWVAWAPVTVGETVTL